MGIEQPSPWLIGDCMSLEVHQETAMVGQRLDDLMAREPMEPQPRQVRITLYREQ